MTEISKLKPPMSDAELKRRRKVQGHIGRTTSTLGLTSVGLLGTSVAARKGSLKAIGVPAKAAQKFKDASYGTSIAAGGIGGVGGFNQAAIYSDEARRRKPKEDMIKRDEMAPQYGEIAKAWSPVTDLYDPEEKRHKRNELAQHATGAAGGVVAAGGAVKALEGIGQQGRAVNMPDTKKAKKLATAAAGKAKVRRGGKIMAVGAGGLAASHVIGQRRKSDSWQTYSKSAFGITHD